MAQTKEPGIYGKSDLQDMFGLRYDQLEKILADAGDDLPTGNNFFNKHKIYTEETVDYIEEHYPLKRKKQ